MSCSHPCLLPNHLEGMDLQEPVCIKQEKDTKTVILNLITEIYNL